MHGHGHGNIHVHALTEQFVNDVHVKIALFQVGQSVAHCVPQPVGETDHHECRGQDVFSQPIGSWTGEIHGGESGEEVIEVSHDELIRVKDQHTLQAGAQLVELKGKQLQQAVVVVSRSAGRERRRLLNVDDGAMGFKGIQIGLG